MDPLNQAALYVLQTLGSLYLMIVLLRFILQLVRADFYNPLSQFIRTRHPAPAEAIAADHSQRHGLGHRLAGVGDTGAVACCRRSPY